MTKKELTIIQRTIIEQSLTNRDSLLVEVFNDKGVMKILNEIIKALKTKGYKLRLE